MALTQVQPAMLGTPQPYNFKNRIINGAMVIDQRNAGASVTPADGAYTLDRWQYSGSQASKFTVQQNAASVTPPAGFVNYLGATVSSAVTIGAGDYFSLIQIIEGYNLADLSWGSADAKTVTLSFWVRSSLTGTFGGALRNSASNRSYPFSYSVPVANTWTQISITIAGDTTGTWLTTNGKGVSVIWSLGTGTTYSGTAGSWAATNYVSATGATSVVGTNGATFYITGVQFEVGVSATGFDYRPYGTELALCQRYYQKFVSTVSYGNLAYGKAYNGTTLNCFRTFYTPMRTTPSTFDSSAANTFFGENGSTSFVGSAIAINPFTTNPYQGGFDISITGATTGAFMSLVANNNAASYIAFGAEL